MARLIPKGWQNMDRIKRDILVVIAAEEGLIGNEIHERRCGTGMAATSAVTARHLGELERAGLIRRERHEDDGRAKRNYLTETGKEHVKKGVLQSAAKIRGDRPVEPKAD